jgi:siroheme synthase (precorrin-2 oxidase/ferrochelatase)
VKRKVGKVRKTLGVSKSKVVVVGLGCSTTVVKGTCVGCGCVLTVANRSLDSHMCRNCFMVGMAEIEAEDLREDSLTDAERLAKFLG